VPFSLGTLFCGAIFYSGTVLEGVIFYQVGLNHNLGRFLVEISMAPKLHFVIGNTSAFNKNSLILASTKRF
jgi:hypothetical protein